MGAPLAELASALPRDVVLLALAFALPDRLGAFLEACGAGDLLLARALAQALELTPEDARADDNRALRRACARGHLAVAQWLADHFALTAEDARARYNDALVFACEHGHLPVAQWLTARFALTAEDARAADNWALRRACAYGHLAVAQWLAGRFALTAEDARAADNAALRGACENGHLAVARWLAVRFALTAEDARAGDNHALRWASAGGHLTVAQWLAGHFALTAADARAWGNGALRSACENGHLAVAQWLTERFAPTCEGGVGRKSATRGGRMEPGFLQAAFERHRGRLHVTAAEDKTLLPLVPRAPGVRERARHAFRFTPEAIYSISAPGDAARLVQIMASVLSAPLRLLTVTDATAGVGGNTIAFAGAFRRVTAVEADGPTAAALRANLATFGLSGRVTVAEADFFAVAVGLEQDAVFIDPPWGGCDYRAKVPALRTERKEGGGLGALLRQVPGPAFLKLPPGYAGPEALKIPGRPARTFRLRKYQIVYIPPAARSAPTAAPSHRRSGRRRKKGARPDGQSSGAPS